MECGLWLWGAIFATQKDRMESHLFTLADGAAFITLDKLLKLMRVVGSGGEAHAVIGEGMVKVNGHTELQKRKKIRAGDRVEFNGEVIQVD